MVPSSTASNAAPTVSIGWEGETIEGRLVIVNVYHVVEVRSYTIDPQTETAPNADMIAP